MDICRVWESHAEDTDKWGVSRRSERPRAVYQVASMDTDSKPKDASEDSDVLGLMMRHLLPTPAVSPPKVTSIQTDRELLLQCLLGTVNHVQPVMQECSGITDIEVLLQSMLPVTSVAEDSVRPPTDRLEPSTRCFSCGEADHVIPLCHVLNESFPFLPPDWRADRVDDEFYCGRHRGGGGVQLSSSGKRRRPGGGGGGLVSRISNDNGPQFPVVCENLPCPAAREVVASRVGAVRPMESVTRRSRVIRNCFRLPCSNSEESDDDVLSVGSRAR